MQETPVAPYLTKFAVERQAQGEGIGGELWSMLARDFPRFFWRSRAGEPDHRLVRASSATASCASPNGTSSGAACAPETIEPAIRYALGAAQRLRVTTSRTRGHFAFHSGAIAPAPPRTGSPVGGPTRAMLAIGARALARFAVLHVGRRAERVGADDAEVGAGAVVLVRDARGDDGDVARQQRDGGAALAAEARGHAALVDAQHLVCGAVVVVHASRGRSATPTTSRCARTSRSNAAAFGVASTPR